MAVINPNIAHEEVDGGIYKEEAEAKDLQGVPSVFADGELIHVGRGGFGELLNKLEAKYGKEEVKAGASNGAAEKDRKSTRLNSSHVRISYAVFCLKKKIEANCVI